jgi:ATP-dependent Zn protease
MMTPTTNDDDDLRSVAFHEAGHAVVALALDLKVARVEIVQDDYSGGTDIENSDHLPLMDRIAICVAGMNAAEMFDALPSHDLANFGDHGLVMTLLTDIDDEAEADALRDQGHQRAWDLLKVHADSVEDIAAQLLAHRKIDLTGYVLER